MLELSSIKSPVVSAAVVALSLVPTLARAAVTEPNGVVVPGPSSVETETSLQDFFDGEGEAIDAVDEAAIEPGTFSPLCDFEAALVLSQSGAQAGISWYNVPEDPNEAPAETHEIVAPGTAVGEVIASADIRDNANYAGGLIGFALIKNGSVAYYSEYQRNVLCSGCDMPDHWKMMLAYPSTNLENAFYLAFEDWEGANESTWHGNDGDFNDKVFRVTGVSCPGGGEPCDTGVPGLCAPGITECVFAGNIECKPQVEPTDEVCDGLDNDCDGEIDQGDLCAEGEVCDRGECVQQCGEVIFNCTEDEVCSPEGFCVDADCAEVTCDPGLVCVGGMCQQPCDGVVCPAPLTCLAGKCADPCLDVECADGRVCDGGVCVLTCDCHACDVGEECTESGECVDQGCGMQTCDAGTVCVAGECVDGCAGAVCPRGEKCLDSGCVAACTGVECDAGQKCIGGLCADSCSDVMCGPGLKCVPGDDNQGDCVDACQGVDCGEGQTCSNGSCGTDCSAVTCPEGEVCVNGACSDACSTLDCADDEVCRGGVCVGVCADVSCPEGQVCDGGMCVLDPADGVGATNTGETSSDLSGSSSGDAASGDTNGSGGTNDGTSSGSSSDVATFDDSTPVSKATCACRLVEHRGQGAWLWLAGLLFMGLPLRRYLRRGSVHDVKPRRAA